MISRRSFVSALAGFVFGLRVDARDTIVPFVPDISECLPQIEAVVQWYLDNHARGVSMAVDRLAGK